ncbi:MAG: class I SAM-dependent methyltransferase, partial [Myxococcales bacterium]|nr:class I SAM-dependent methyltransferase [Myxococcales bacterium]
RGEIPFDGGAPLPVSKVVVDQSAGMLGSIYDEDESDDDSGLLDEEPQELDADDLVEEELSVVAEEPGPPPAPSRPPARPTVEVGPPPPPISSASLDTAMAALPVAPAMDEGWQIDAFGEHAAALLPPQRPHVVASEAEFIAHCASLAPGAAVLDVGCGDGAHCVALAARGLAVTGLDPSPAQLVRASQNAQAMGVTVDLVAGDMRQPVLEGQFDAVLCLGGTLGLFGDEDDRLALQHMHDRLLPGGRLVLHVLNREYIAGRLPARSWWQGQGCLVLDEAQMFSATSRLHVHRTVVFETGTQFEHNLGLRVYSLTELIHMCAHVGLRVLEFSGSRHTRGRFYGATSSEIWLVAQRPPA